MKIVINWKIESRVSDNNSRSLESLRNLWQNFENLNPTINDNKFYLSDVINIFSTQLYELFDKHNQKKKTINFLPAKPEMRAMDKQMILLHGSPLPKKSSSAVELLRIWIACLPVITADRSSLFFLFFFFRPLDLLLKVIFTRILGNYPLYSPS